MTRTLAPQTKQVNGRVLLGMVGYDSMAAAVFEALRAELSLRTMRLQHHVSRHLSPQTTTFPITQPGRPAAIRRDSDPPIRHTNTLHTEPRRDRHGHRP